MRARRDVVFYARAREVAGGWRLYTHPVFHELLEEYAVSWDTRKLSHAMLETLAIVAYPQPCTRAHVAATRVVTSDSSVASLVSKGLLREAGTSDALGNLTLYATTPEFLEKFGLRSVKDLPALGDFAPDAPTKAQTRERLSAHKITQAEVEEAQLGADRAQAGVDGSHTGAGDARAGEDGSHTGAGEARAGEDGVQIGAGNARIGADGAQTGEIAHAINRTNVREDNNVSSSSHGAFNQDNESSNNPLDDLMPN